MNEQLDSITYDLFSRSAIEILNGGDSTDELYGYLVTKANQAISDYGWKIVFDSWQNYMHKNCHTVEEALNFATWFEIYGGHNQIIDEPYKFLAYLYDIFDLNPVKYNAQILDDVSYGLLEAAGIKKNLWMDDSYTTETDPELISAVESLRNNRE